MNIFKKFFSKPASSVSPSDQFGAPVFVFAACWRTGSTLLQRVLNASGEILVWGEPGCLKEIEKLSSRCQVYLEKSPSVQAKHLQGQTGQWIPTISPAPESGVLALRGLFQGLFGTEAAELGFKRWGFKEVRPGAARQIEMLCRLFPEGKFVFLLRDPLDTLRSLQGKNFFRTLIAP